MKQNSMKPSDVKDKTKSNILVTRVDWALSNSLKNLGETDSIPRSRPIIIPSNESASDRIARGRSIHNRIFGQYDTGLCCVLNVSDDDKQSIDETSFESRVAECDTRLFTTHEIKNEHNSFPFSFEKDIFPNRFWSSRGKDKITIDLGENYLERGVVPFPESVFFYFRNLPYLEDSLGPDFTRTYGKWDMECDAHGQLLVGKKLSCIVGPVKWIEYPNVFVMLVHKLIIRFKKKSNGKVGVHMKMDPHREIMMIESDKMLQKSEPTISKAEEINRILVNQLNNNVSEIEGPRNDQHTPSIG